MFKFTVKYHIRTGQMYMLLSFCMMGVLMGTLIRTNMLLLIVPFLLQKTYLNVLEQGVAPLRLLRISECNIGKIYRSSNLSIMLWSTTGIVVGVMFLIILDVTSSKFEIEPMDIVMPVATFTAQSIMCLTIGNTIDNSDLRTSRWWIIRNYMPQVAYTMFAAMATSLASVCALISIYAIAALCAVALVIWLLTVRQHVRINHFETFII